MSFMDDLPDYPTKHWYAGIKKLAFDFLSFLTKKKNARYVVIDENNLENVFRYFYITLNDITQRIYGSNNTDNQLDKHKILAIYIKSILVNKPFQFDSKIKAGIFRSEKLANEFFCITLIETILKSWEPGEAYKNLNIPRHEKSWFIMLLHRFTLSPDIIDILSLSQIIFYLEKMFFR